MSAANNDALQPPAPAPPPAASATPTKKLSRTRKWLYRLAAMTLVPACILGLLEISLRLCGYGDATDFFQIPTGRVVEVGTQVAV